MQKTKTLQLGMIGLGRMGSNMVRRLVKGGHECVVYDTNAKAVTDAVQQRVSGALSLEAQDTVIDGGNSYYRDDIRRAATLKSRMIHYVDVGTSGGVAGQERGY